MGELSGSIEITLDRLRHLRYSFRALERMEDHLGSGLPELAAAPKMRQIRTVLWAGLADEDPALTPEATSDLVDLAPGDTVAARLEYISGRIAEAFAAAGLSSDGEKKTEEAAR